MSYLAQVPLLVRMEPLYGNRLEENGKFQLHGVGEDLAIERWCSVLFFIGQAVYQL